MFAEELLKFHPAEVQAFFVEMGVNASLSFTHPGYLESQRWEAF